MTLEPFSKAFLIFLGHVTLLLAFEREKKLN
jgi:hypothetical protein